MSDTTPYGSIPPESDKEEEIVAEQPVVEPEVKAEPEPDYKKSYEELHKKFGEHSNVVGELRKQNQTLAQQMAELQQQAKASVKEARNEPPPTDYEKMLSDIAEKLETGELSEREALVQSNKITREWTKAEAAQEKEQLLTQARSEVQNILAAKDSEKVVEKFHEQNPDFKELMAQGALEPLKAEDPLLDDLAAFWKYRANVAAQEKAAAFEQGKLEALRIKSGSEKAGKVISDPGTSMQQQKPSKATDAELRAVMLSHFNE